MPWPEQWKKKRLEKDVLWISQWTPTVIAVTEQNKKAVCTINFKKKQKRNQILDGEIER